MYLGEKRHSLALILLIISGLSGYSQRGISYRHHFNEEAALKSAVAPDRSVIIDYSVSQLDLSALTNEYGSFYKLAIPGHTRTYDIGKPELPVLSRLIEIPEGCTYNIKISNVKVSKLKPSKDRIKGVLFPAQEEETKELQQKKPQFKIDKALYASRSYIPSDTVSIKPLGILRHKHLANLVISPVFYNPKRNIMEVITSMKIEVSFSLSKSYDAKSAYPESPLFTSALKKSLLNYTPGDFINGYSDKPVGMIILTDTSFRKQLQPYVTWKKQKGFKVDVLYRGDDYAGVTYSQLRDTIAGIYNSSTDSIPPPEYLLIVGSVGKIPYYGSGQVTDMYYGELNGEGDYIPDMYIGRLPVEDTAELKEVVKKLIQYEKFDFTPANTFYSRSLITAGASADNYDYYMDGQVKYGVDNYLTPANHIEDHHFYYSASGTAKDSIIKLINGGLSFINYTGHGDYTGWLYISSPNYATTGLKTGDIQYFTNKDMYPFIITNACETSNFNTASFGNKLVTAGDKGAIGYIGCSNLSYWDEDFFWAVGTGTPSEDPLYETTGLGALDRLFHTHNESPSDWDISMGQVNFAGNLSVSASSSPRKKYYWETYNLVGDPSIIPYIGTPSELSTVLPDTLPNNIQSYSFTGEPFTYAAVSHFDTLWDASYVSASGAITLNMPGIADDSCLFVITGQNRKPFIKTIYFSTINKEFLNLSGSRVNDDAGNANGLADFGETLSPAFTISNMGTVDADSLYIKLSTDSDWATMNSDSAYIGTLRAGTAVNLDDIFSITLSRDVPDKGIISFDLYLKDSKNEKHFRSDMSVHAPNLQLAGFTIDDSSPGNRNFVADPGETFKLIFRVLNTGTSNTSGQLNVFSPDEENITILEPDKSSGILQSGEVTDIPVLVKLPDAIASGTTVTLAVNLNCDPINVTGNYSFRIGRIRESFESASFRIFPWINISPVPWEILPSASFEGSFGARSGKIGGNQSTSLSIRTIYQQDDSIKFWYKVSSEQNFDFFIVKLNGVEVLRESGEIGWTLAAIPVPEGVNTLEWDYQKDVDVDKGSDCAMIDLIDFAGPGTVNYISRDLSTARIVSPIDRQHLEMEPVIIKVLNVGPDTIKGFNMAYDINDGNPVFQHFNNTLIPFGDSLTVTFDRQANLSAFGDYKIRAYGYNNNDNYTPNDTIEVNLRNNEIAGPLLVYPNPFRDILKIVINSLYTGDARVMLFNVKGEKILETEKAILTGINYVEINGRALAPSTYYLRVEFPGISHTVPVIKIK